MIYRNLNALLVFVILCFLAALERDLRAGFPAVVSITGHAVVVDGLLVVEDEINYHINYGWGGTNNGWDAADTIQSSSITDGVTSMQAPEIEGREGWTFTGWKVGFAEVTGDLTVMAEYTETGASILVHRGVNLCGAEFGQSSLPGTYGTHYIYPDTDTIRYFLAKGMTTIRLPFRWERLQRDLESALDDTELMRLRTAVETITTAGGTVVLDPHNFAAYNGHVIGTAHVTQAAFADFWGRLAAEFADNQRVVFGLMNEPHDIQATVWLAAANAAIAAIRTAGASNLILVPGVNWTSSFSWYEDYGYGVNADTMTGIVDPADHYAVEVHLYFDSDNSGTTSNVVSPTIGRERLVGFVNWCRTHGIRGFLGEVGAPATAEGDVVLDDTLVYLETEANDVFLGWIYWAAGQWWPADYLFIIQPADPTNLALERRQLTVMAPYLPLVHTVEFRAGTHGAITAGASWQSVPQGGGATPPTVQADEGWVFSGWDADSASVLDDLIVTAVYERVFHRLTYIAGENGRIDGEQEVVQTVEYGQDGGFVTALPDTGYRFHQWSDGVPTAARSDTNVTADLTVTAEFEPKWVPDIAWPTPAAIVYGTPLDEAQLNAEADTEGEFVYAPPGGTILGTGVHTLSVAFTPVDEVNWAASAATVELTVLAGARLYLWVTADGGGTAPLEFGEAAGAADGEDEWDAPAQADQVARLVCPFPSVDEPRHLARDFRPVADLTRWRLEVGAPSPPQGGAVHPDGAASPETRNLTPEYTLTWDVGAADPAREVWLQQLDDDERPVGFPLEMKAVDELPGVAPGTVFEIVYGIPQRHTIELRRGWNAVGTPRLTLASLGELATAGRSGGVIAPAWRWSGNGFARVGRDDAFAPETGHMVLCLAEFATMEISGLPSDGALTLAPGWNLVSPVAMGRIPEDVHGRVSLWRFIGERGSLVPVAADSLLELGVAYWIHVDGDTSLFLERF